MYGQFRCRTRFAKLTITASNIRKPKHDYSKNEKIIGRIAYVNSIEEGYKGKVLKYIIHLTEEKKFKQDIDIVNEYNKNKFYKLLPDMEYE